MRRLFLSLLLVLTVPVVGVAPAVSARGVITCFGEPATVVGSEGDDTIDLSDGSHGSGPHVVATLGGADLVIGSDGGDVVCLGDGKDEFRGGDGDDLASGGPGRDRLRGGDGKDELHGDGNDDRLRGNQGRDELVGGSGDDLLKGGKGDDTLTAGAGDDEARGGGGDDVINGGDASTSNAQSGLDVLNGGRGYDRLWSNWSRFDFDADSLLDGGRDYDYCMHGAVKDRCERTHYKALTIDDAKDEWRDLMTEVFAIWGLDEEDCEDVGGEWNGTTVPLENHCVGPQIENALSVMVCESWGFPFAQASSTGVTGLFQHRPQYWDGRVANAQAALEGMDVDYDWPNRPNAFDPEVNAMVAAYLVWYAREVQLGRIFYSGYWDPYPSQGNYVSQYAKGPEPWGPWSCGLPRNLGLHYPEWVHPSFDGV